MNQGIYSSNTITVTISSDISEEFITTYLGKKGYQLSRPLKQFILPEDEYIFKIPKHQNLEKSLEELNSTQNKEYIFRAEKRNIQYERRSIAIDELSKQVHYLDGDETVQEFEEKINQIINYAKIIKTI